MSESRKVTYQLSEEVVREVREAVRDGYAASMSRFVEDAMWSRLREIAAEKVRERMRQAALDQRVIEDIALVESELQDVEEQL